MVYSCNLILLVIAVLALFPISKSSTSKQIANPASVNCIDNGGHLKIMSDANGAYGVCFFDDNSECEEWAFYRGTCKKDDSLN